MFKKIIANIIIAFYTRSISTFSESIIYPNNNLSGMQRRKHKMDSDSSIFLFEEFSDYYSFPNYENNTYNLSLHANAKWSPPTLHTGNFININSFSGSNPVSQDNFIGTNCEKIKGFPGTEFRGIPIYRSLQRQIVSNHPNKLNVENTLPLHIKSFIDCQEIKTYPDGLMILEAERRKKTHLLGFGDALSKSVILPSQATVLQTSENTTKGSSTDKKINKSLDSFFENNLVESSSQPKEVYPERNLEKLNLLQKLNSWIITEKEVKIKHPNHEGYDLYSNNNIHHTFAILFMDW